MSAQTSLALDGWRRLTLGGREYRAMHDGLGHAHAPAGTRAEYLRGDEWRPVRNWTRRDEIHALLFGGAR